MLTARQMLMKIVKYIAALALLCSTLVATAQTTDEQLAVQYFQNGEFDKAAMYYEKLYSRNPTRTYYEYYIKCLVELDRIKDAEKVIKKQLKRDPANLTYYVDMGMMYKSIGEETKSKQQFDRALKELRSNQRQVINLANAFIKVSEHDYALETYLKGQKLIKHYPFNFEIASIYGLKGDVEHMVNEYLELLNNNEAYLQSVQNSLSRTIDFENDEARVDILKTQLLRRIQRQPQKDIYAEMLIWLFTQRKDFNSAFIQTRALDKRNKGMGERVVALARLCTSNKNYSVAIKCYEYVVGIGAEGYYYTQSKIELLNTIQQKITSSNYSTEDLTKLQTNYQSTLDELGKSTATVSLMRDYAHLKAFYLHNTNDAIQLLEETINLPGIDRKTQAKAKLELGDILVVQGEIWDASLYFSQVDKDFKHDILEHEAKFRNARISYYTGDFELAQSRLDILKASTSKLIANDAMDLSLLITDNLGLDTTRAPMLTFSRADLLTFQNKLEEATLALDSIIRDYPGHALTDEILYQKYKIYYKQRNFTKAAEYLERIVEQHGKDILGDDALFNLALLNETQLNNPEKAKELYKQFLMEHGGSFYEAEARKRFRTLRGDKLEKEEPEDFH